MQKQNNFKYIYKGKELSLKELKEITINNTSLGLGIVDILGVTLCDNRDYIYKLIEEKNLRKKEAHLGDFGRRGKTIIYNKEVNSEGVKTNSLKPQMSLLFKQFPKALEAIVKCSEYGHSKYKETDKDYLNYTRVDGGSKTYADAGLRHRLEQGNDLESGLPHQFHVAWNALAELQLWIQENE